MVGPFKKTLLHTGNRNVSGEFQENQTPAPPYYQLSDDILNVPFSQEEVINSLNSLKNNKSPGPDGIASEFLKTTKHYISPLLTKIFNQMLNTGIFPHTWGRSIICPIFKGGNKDEPDSYRGISLIDTLCKTLTIMLDTEATDLV